MGGGDGLHVGGADARGGRLGRGGRDDLGGRRGLRGAGGAGAPVGSLMTVPASRTPDGLSPFIAAIALTDTRAPAARPESVSPGRTV